MRIGYLECFSGISGDMLLGALVDAGVPFATLAETAEALNVGAQLEMRKVMRGGLAATKVDVLTPEDGHEHGGHEHGGHEHGGHEHPHPNEQPGAPGLDFETWESTNPNRGSRAPFHSPGAPGLDSETWDTGNSESTMCAPPLRHSARVGEHQPPPADALPHEHAHERAGHAHHRSLSAILAIIESAPLPHAVKQRSMRAFQMLGEAEAAIHAIPIESVHFHEVGAVDTIADIVCSAAGCELLGIDRWMSSPLNVGSGTVKCAHGILPVPAPATLRLLGEAPVYAAGEPMERVTPTGATLLRMLDVSFGPLPAMSVKTTGYGAGGKETAGQPNLLRLLVGEAAEEQATEPIAILETVIDDTSPQLIAYVSDLLLEAGAWDVYRAAVQMKKGRTGVQLTVLCRPELVGPLRELLFRETTTIGVHWRIESKMALAREFRKVSTPWGEVAMKIARWPSGKIANAAPEYEDCRRIATANALPLKQVMHQAMLAFAQTEGTN